MEARRAMSAMADVIVVLGCRVVHGAPSAALDRRIRLAARAYHAGLAPRVVASGGRTWEGHTEAGVIAAALRERQVSQADINMELCSLTTLENAHYCAEWMRERGMKRALLASCPWHLGRAQENFAAFGVETVVPPAHWHEPQPVPALRPLREFGTRLFDAALLRAFRGNLG